MDGGVAVTTTAPVIDHRTSEPPVAPRRDGWWWFLAATVVAALGMALAYGALTPHGFAADEAAHTAYADELRNGRLPDVDTLQPTSPFATDRSDGSSRGPTPPRTPASEDYIYVANHPPAFAALQAAMTDGLQAAGLADDATVAVGRALNALCTLGAVVVLSLLGREVTGNLRTGVLAAALFAAIPALWSLATFGYSDGAATLTVTLVVWAGVAAWNRGTTQSMGLLGLAVAGAGATRATALVVAVAVAAMVLVRQAVRHGANRTGRRNRWALLRSDVALVALPPLAISAWWYIRNWMRFGDPTASAVLNGRLHRSARPDGIIPQLLDLDLWQRVVTQVTASSYTPNPLYAQVRLAPWAVWTMGLAALVALGGLLRPPPEEAIEGIRGDGYVRREPIEAGPAGPPDSPRTAAFAPAEENSHGASARHETPMPMSARPGTSAFTTPTGGRQALPEPVVWQDGADGRATGLPSTTADRTDSDLAEPTPTDAAFEQPRFARPQLRGLPVMVAAVFGVLFGLAGHVSDGGAPHGRYLLLAMPMLCLILTVGLEQIGHRLPLVAVAAATVASLWMLRESTRWVDHVRAVLLVDRFGPAQVSAVGVTLVIIGIVAAVTAVIAAGRRSERA